MKWWKLIINFRDLGVLQRWLPATPFNVTIVPPLVSISEAKHHCNFFEVCCNLGLLTSECSWFKNSLQIQPKRVSLLMTPSFSQHLSKFSQHKQNSLYISNPSAFLIIEAAHFGCCRMKSLISAMETFGLQWSFFKSSIQLKNCSPIV